MRIAFILIILLAAFSCNENKYVDRNENNGDAVITLEGDDEKMNKAIEEAGKTYPSFLKVIGSKDSAQSEFAVKMRFAYGEDNGEHMWLNNLFYKNDTLWGTLNSDPLHIKNVKWGDTFEIQKEKVTDWMYVQNNKLVGGYTIRVLYNKMSEEEKKEFEKEMSFSLK